MKDSDTVYLLDSSIYIFQAWFGYPDHFHDQAGQSVNAVYGYMKTLLTQCSALRPKYMLAAFDESLFSGFRHQLYPDYKANRALPDESLARQLQLCRQLTELAGVCCAGDAVYEADDWLALGAQTAKSAGLRCTVITRDKDLAQLVEEGDLWWDWAKDVRRDHRALTEHWQVEPPQIPDLLALMGDSADNIPGVAGIGEKSAQALISHFGSLESLYSNLDAVLTLPVRGAKRLHGVLQASEDQAFLFRELIRLRPPPDALTLNQLEFSPVGQDKWLDFISAAGLGNEFKNLVSRYYA